MPKPAQTGADTHWRKDPAVNSTTMTRAMSYQAAGTAFHAAVGFALVMALGRLLPPATLAQYISLLSAMAVAVILIGGGNASWLYRAGVAHGGSVPRGALGNAVAQAAIATFAVAAVAAFWQGPPAALAMLCAGTIVFADFVSMQLRARGWFGWEAAWQAGVRLISALAILGAMLWFGPTTSVIFLGWLLATGFSLAFAARYCLAPPRLSGLRAHALQVAPIVLVDGLLALLTRGDVVVLSTRIAPTDLAAYAVDSRFIEAAILAFAPVSNVQMRNLGTKLDVSEQFTKAWRHAAGIGFALGLTALIASLVAGKWVVGLIFGATYLEAGKLLPWLALSLPMLLANLVLAQAMLVTGREKELVLVLALGAAAWALGLLYPLGSDLRIACAGAAIAHAGAMSAMFASLRVRV
jgi:O-antigen/teichoic acid export membrane protein